MTFLRFFEDFDCVSDPVAEDDLSFDGELRLGALPGDAALPCLASLGSVILIGVAPLEHRECSLVKRSRVGAFQSPILFSEMRSEDMCYNRDLSRVVTPKCRPAHLVSVESLPGSTKGSEVEAIEC